MQVKILQPIAAALRVGETKRNKSMTPELVKALIACDAAALLVTDTAPDQDQLQAWPKVFGSLAKAFDSAEWKAAVPAFANDGPVMTAVQFKALLEGMISTRLVGDSEPDDVQLQEFPKIVGSLLKAFGTAEWKAAVPALAQNDPANLFSADQFAAWAACHAAAVMVTDKIPSQDQLAEYPKVLGSLLKAFSSEAWLAVVEAFRPTPAAPPTPPAAPTVEPVKPAEPTPPPAPPV